MLKPAAGTVICWKARRHGPAMGVLAAPKIYFQKLAGWWGRRDAERLLRSGCDGPESLAGAQGRVGRVGVLPLSIAGGLITLERDLEKGQINACFRQSVFPNVARPGSMPRLPSGPTGHRLARCPVAEGPITCWNPVSTSRHCHLPRLTLNDRRSGAALRDPSSGDYTGEPYPSMRQDPNPLGRIPSPSHGVLRKERPPASLLASFPWSTCSCSRWTTTQHLAERQASGGPCVGPV